MRNCYPAKVVDDLMSFEADLKPIVVILQQN